MMRPSQVLSLIVAGGALAGAGLWLASRQPTDSPTQESSAPVLSLSKADLNAVTRLRIFKGDGSHTTLTRNATHWVVAERGYPADTGQVRSLLLDLSSLKVEEPKTADPGLYAKLGVEDPSGVQSASTGVDIDLNGRTQQLIVGHTSGTASVYLRLGGQPRSVLATPQLTPDADPRHWLDRALLDIAPDRIAEVTEKPPGGPEYTIKRAAAATPGVAPEYAVTPIPKGRELADATTAASQAGALAGLQLDDVRKPGSTAAVAHATFATSDGLMLEIAGIQDGAQRFITVTVSAAQSAVEAQARELNARLSGWEFELPGYRYDSVFRPLEQLLKPKAVPAGPAASGIPPHSPGSAPLGLPFGPPKGDSH